MDATKRLPTAFGSRGRLIGLCMAAVLVLCGAVGAPNAGAKKLPGKVYMAMGDSLAFGYTQQVYNKLRKYENAQKHEPEPEAAQGFHRGYANVYVHALAAEALTAKTARFGPKRLENLGCPRETTSSLIGDGPAAEVLGSLPEPASGEAPCLYEQEWLDEAASWKQAGENASGSGGPLHLNYFNFDSQVEESQLEEALRRIASGKGDDAIGMLTLDIGDSDVQRLIATCEQSAPTSVAECLSDHAEATIATIATNVSDIVYALRNAATLFPARDGYVDYTGPIIFVTGFNPYGIVKDAAEGGTGEVVPGSNELTAQVTSAEQTALAGEPNLCVTNLQPEFNPGYGEPADEMLEAKRLKEWTNMANPKVSHHHKDGPDPDTTPAGGSEIATLMEKQCPYNVVSG